MRIDQYGQMVFEEKDLLEIYYQNPDKILNKVLVDSDINFSDILELENIPKLTTYHTNNIDLNEFDKTCQNVWHMPEQYYNMDIAKWVLDQCKDDSELQRAGQELLLFQEKDMFNLLKYLKYLVDTMRDNNIVWGVGRGSSVASFVLYLIGIHKINSLYYQLDIEEFLK